MKVMLAKEAKLIDIKFPCYASPKIDGIRCHIDVEDNKVVALTRANKPIPNELLRQKLIQSGINYFDGELTLGEPTSPNVFRNTTSVVMSKEHPDWDKIQFNVFDLAIKQYPFSIRKNMLDIIQSKGFIRLVEQRLITNVIELSHFEEECLKKGYEGICTRSVDGFYKEGRSTLKEQKLLKIKRFKDAEAIVVGFEEKMHNENELTVNELGHAHRSSCKDAMIPADTLGALVVNMNGTVFSIGSGFDNVTRDYIWANRDNLIGSIVKFKYFPVGVKDAPRFPIFLGFRDKDDM